LILKKGQTFINEVLLKKPQDDEYLTSFNEEASAGQKERPSQKFEEKSSCSEENVVPSKEEIKDEMLCKICFTQEKAIVFVPCGHLLTCVDCGFNLKDCPVCRKEVTSAIRTFMS